MIRHLQIHIYARSVSDVFDNVQRLIINKEYNLAFLKLHKPRNLTNIKTDETKVYRLQSKYI